MTQRLEQFAENGSTHIYNRMGWTTDIKPIRKLCVGNTVKFFEHVKIYYV